MGYSLTFVAVETNCGVRQILAISPGQHDQLVFDRPSGNSLHVDAGADCRINLTRDLEGKLARCLMTTKAERRKVAFENEFQRNSNSVLPRVGAIIPGGRTLLACSCRQLAGNTECFEITFQQPTNLLRFCYCLFSCR